MHPALSLFLMDNHNFTISSSPAPPPPAPIPMSEIIYIDLTESSPSTPLSPEYYEPLTPQYVMDSPEYPVDTRPVYHLTEDNYLLHHEKALIIINTNISICRLRQRSLTNKRELLALYEYWKKQLASFNAIQDPSSEPFWIDFTPIN